MGNIGELFVQLGVKAETTKLGDFAKSLMTLNLGAILTAGTVGMLVYKLAELVEGATKAAIAFQKFNFQTGLSSVELQKWQLMGERANVSAETVSQSFQAVQKNLAEIRMGRGNIAPFQILGVSAQSNAFQVLEQVRQRIKGLDNATATNLITQMGFSPEMINVLKMSNDEFAKMGDLSKLIMTPKQQQAFLDMNKQIVIMKQEFAGLGRQLAVAIVPILSAMVKIIGTLSNMFSKLIDFVIDLPNRVKFLTTAFGFLMEAINPIMGVFKMIFLLLDDFSVYMSGGKSMIGEFIKMFARIGKNIANDFAPFINNVIGPLKNLGKELSPYLKIFDALGNVGSILAQVASGNIGGAITDVVSAGKNIVSNKSNSSTNNTTIHVHTNAPAEVVGKHIANEVKRSNNQASLLQNNSGS